MNMWRSCRKFQGDFCSFPVATSLLCTICSAGQLRSRLQILTDHLEIRARMNLGLKSVSHWAKFTGWSFGCLELNPETRRGAVFSSLLRRRRRRKSAHNNAQFRSPQTLTSRSMNCPNYRAGPPQAHLFFVSKNAVLRAFEKFSEQRRHGGAQRSPRRGRRCARRHRARPAEPASCKSQTAAHTRCGRLCSCST